MKITARDVNGIKVVDLDGNMKTPSDMEDFTNFIEKELAADQKKFLLNFVAVHFINSSGLGRLILASKKITEKKGSLGVINLNPDVDELFTITRIKEKIPVFADEPTALEHLK
jgi:anti-sigma B factor antagonist